MNFANFNSNYEPSNSN